MLRSFFIILILVISKSNIFGYTANDSTQLTSRLYFLEEDEGQNISVCAPASNVTQLQFSGQITHYFTHLLKTSDYPRRWDCGNWTPFHGWLYLSSDLLIFLFYITIPIGLFYYIRRKNFRFRRLLYLFALFICLCGITHLIDAVIFWIPIYNINSLAKFITMLVSGTTAVALIKFIPIGLELKSPSELEHEISLRKQSEEHAKTNEKKYRQIFENAGVGVALVGKSGNILICNNYLQRFFGYTQSELVSISKLTDSNFNFLTSEYSQVLSEDSESVQLNKSFETKSGAKVWATVSLSKFNDESVQIVIKDITKELNLQNVLRQKYVYEQFISEKTRLMNVSPSLLEGVTQLGNDLADLLEHYTVICANYASHLESKFYVTNSDERSFSSNLNEENDFIFQYFKSFKQEEILKTNDYCSFSNTELTELRNYPYAMFRPITVNHKLCGYIGVLSKEENAKWSFLEQELLKKTTGILSDSFNEKYLETQLINEQKKYKALYHHTPALLQSIDENGNITSISQFWLEKMGYTHQEVMNRNFSDFIYGKNSKKLCKPMLDKLYKDNVINDYECQFVTKGGEVIDVLLSFVMDSNSSHENKQYLGVLNDVSDLRKAQEKIQTLNESLEKKVLQRTNELKDTTIELENQKNLLEGIINNTNSVISIVDEHGKFILVNSSFMKLYNLNNQKVIGSSRSEIFANKSSSISDKIDKECLETGKLIETEELYVDDNGQQRFFLTIRFPIKAPQKFKVVCCIKVEISDQKQQQEKLNDQAEALKRANTILRQNQLQLELSKEKLVTANEELESFSYSVSHDLRAPLRALEGFADLLAQEYESKIDERGLKWLDIIKSNSVKMDQLINDVLEFSRISRKELKKNSVNMLELIQTVLTESLTDEISDKLELNISKIHSVNGDETSLKQVWTNLIGNALKYSSKNKRIIINIESIDKGDEIHYIIEDNGVGFDDTLSNNIFNLFYRLHKEEDFRGAGVGLSISKKIIEKHEGKISAQGKIGEGAKFTFSIPKT